MKITLEETPSEAEKSVTNEEIENSLFNRNLDTNRNQNSGSIFDFFR